MPQNTDNTTTCRPLEFSTKREGEGSLRVYLKVGTLQDRSKYNMSPKNPSSQTPLSKDRKPLRK